MTVRATRWRPPLPDGEARPVALSPMLGNVLDSLCEARTNREIARDWGISEDTVKTHLKRLFAALGATCREHAIVLVFSGAVDVWIKPPQGRWAERDQTATLRQVAPYPPRS